MNFPNTEFTAAGLGPSDLADLFRVSRVTGHNWMRGKRVHPLIQHAVRYRLGQLRVALSEQRLPLITNMPRAERAQAIAAALDGTQG